MKKFIAVLLFLLVAGSANAETINLTDEQIQETIENAVSWMQNAQESSGHFRYEYMPFWDRYTDDDNMVRQAGALYVLGEVAVKMGAEFDLKRNLEKAIDYFDDNSVDGEFNNYNFKCLLKTKDYCTLGGTSLVLTGLLDLIESDPSLKNKYSDSIEEYKNYIMAMKISDKGFRDKYYIKNNATQTDKESHFSNGEALLGLVRYYLYNPSEEVKETIEESLEYFIEIYYETWDPNFYLWGMAALKDWYQLFPEEKYYDFVKDYTNWRIDGQKNARETSHNKCAYIEGVISAYSVLKTQSTDTQKEKYLEEINFWLTKSQTLQLKATDIVKIIFNKNGFKTLKLKKSARAIGGFITDWSEPFQRIDFTQHCLSSYLQRL